MPIVDISLLSSVQYWGKKRPQIYRRELAHSLLSELVEILSLFFIFCYFDEFLGEGQKLALISPFFLEA